MSAQDLPPRDQVLCQLRTAIKRRKRYASWDFRWAHLFIWLSILASSTSSILVARGLEGELHQTTVAIIAGIPALAILIDKTFDFKARSVWGNLFLFELQKIYNKLLFEKIDPYEASEAFYNLCIKFELDYARIGFFGRKDADQNQDNSTETTTKPK